MNQTSYKTHSVTPTKGVGSAPKNEMIYKNVLMKTPTGNNDAKLLSMTPSSQYKEGFAEIIKRQLLAA